MKAGWMFSHIHFLTEYTEHESQLNKITLSLGYSNGYSSVSRGFYSLRLAYYNFEIGQCC